MKRLLILFCLTALIFSLINRFSSLNEAYWADEANQIRLSQRSGSIYQTYQLHRHSQGEPPLYSLLLHVWLYFGDSITWMRLLSSLIGVLALIYLYKIGQILNFPSFLRLLSVALVASSWVFVHYSEEIRNYSLSITSTFATIYYLLRFQKKLIPAHLVGILTHYGNWLFFPFIAAILFFRRPTWRNSAFVRYLIVILPIFVFLILNQLLVEINYIDLSYTARNRLASYAGLNLAIQAIKYNVDLIAYIFGANPWFYDATYFPLLRQLSFYLYYFAWATLILFFTGLTVYLVIKSSPKNLTQNLIVFLFPVYIFIVVNLLSLFNLYPIGPIRMSLFYAPLVVVAYFNFVNLALNRYRLFGWFLIALTSILILNNLFRLYRMPHRHLGFNNQITQCQNINS